MRFLPPDAVMAASNLQVAFDVESRSIISAPVYSSSSSSSSSSYSSSSYFFPDLLSIMTLFSGGIREPGRHGNQ